MSDSNKLELSIVEETTWGVTPNAAFDKVPVIGGGMNLDTETIRSAAIRTDGQRGGSYRTNVTANGSMEFELTANVYDLLLLRAMRNTTGFSTAVNITGTNIAAVAAGNKYTGPSGMNTNVADGQWLYFSGFAAANNNGWKKVVSATATEIVVAGSDITNESAGPSITIGGQWARNEAASPSFTIQQEHLDETDKFEVVTGARINAFGIDIASKAMIAASAGFTGKDYDPDLTAKQGNGSVNALTTQASMSEVDAFDGFYIDGSVISTYKLTGVSLELSTPTREQTGLGSIEKLGVPLGNLELSGSLSVYKNDASWNLLTKYKAFTPFGFAFSIVDENGNRYLFDMPKTKLTNESGAHPGPDADTVLDFPFAAEPDAALNKTFQVCKLAAA